jgi:GYF domain 2
MADRWFFTHDRIKKGPYSGQELRDIADAGHILPLDTIWKEGVEKGMTARKVKNLFPDPLPNTSAVSVAVPPPPQTPSTLSPVEEKRSDEAIPERAPVAAGPAPELDLDPDNVQLQPEWTPPGETPPPAPALPTKPKHVRKGRAVAGAGAVLCGQDGVNVKFKKKCIVCSYEDSTWNTMKITNGTMKSTYFCPKCRKIRAVEMRGSVC